MSDCHDGVGRLSTPSRTWKPCNREKATPSRVVVVVCRVVALHQRQSGIFHQQICTRACHTFTTIISRCRAHASDNNDCISATKAHLSGEADYLATFACMRPTRDKHTRTQPTERNTNTRRPLVIRTTSLCLLTLKRGLP